MYDKIDNVNVGLEIYIFEWYNFFGNEVLNTMAKKNSRNTDILKDTKDITSPKIYSLLVQLVNMDREDLAEDVLKIDYLLTYTNNCIKDKDIKQAKDTLKMAKTRIDKLIENNIDVEYLIYLYDGINSKIK